MLGRAPLSAERRATTFDRLPAATRAAAIPEAGFACAIAMGLLMYCAVVGGDAGEKLSG
jgi:hypothetical protein